MIIIAKYASSCPVCHGPIQVGGKVEWVKGSPARHAACAGATSATVSNQKPQNWSPNQFNGYGARRGGYSRACSSGGNCSSIGSGRSCGGHDCDGH